MAYTEEQLMKLTTVMAEDIDLYNEIIAHEQKQEELIVSNQDEKTLLENKLKDSESREQKYLGQISNLLGKIPVGETKQTQSFEQKLEEIKNKEWKK